MNEQNLETRSSPLRSSAVAALAAGTLSAAVAALPAALRVSASVGAWVALAGAAAVVLGPVLAGMSRTRPLKVALFSVLVGLGLSALPLALLAAKLMASTHHRPLGAVTFAILAVLVVLGFTVVALRLTTRTRKGPRGASARHWVRGGLALCALAGPAFLAGGVFSAPSARASVLDVGLALACAAVLGLSPWPASLVRLASRAGLPVWVALVGSGLVVGLSGAGESARQASPALFAPFGWFIF